MSILLLYLGSLVTLGRLSLGMVMMQASRVVVVWSLDLECWFWLGLLGLFSS